MNERDLITESLQITDQTAGVLNQSARWAKFLSIVGFVMTGFMILASFILPELLARNTYAMPEMTVPVQGLRINFIIMAVLLFIPCLFLFRFSTKMKEALADNNQYIFEESFRNLKSTFKFYGIVTIIVLSIYALALVVGMLIAMFTL